jgi:hypothetical protein
MRRFQATIYSEYILVNSKTLTIFCECTEKDIDLAITAFGGTLIKDPQVSLQQFETEL